MPTGVRSENASIAIDLDDKSESARLQPERDIPRDERRQQSRNEEQIRIPSRPML
jgi:hypothetical protein